MPVPSLISDLSTVAASNSPDGASESPKLGDDYIRTYGAFIAQIRDMLNGTSNSGTIKNPVFSGAATGTLSSLPTISATSVTWSGNPTHSGTHTWSGGQVFSNTAFFFGGTSFLGSASFDINPDGRILGLTYTPTPIAVANCTSPVGNKCKYIRVGPVIWVAGSCSANITTGGVATQIDIPLPISSNLAAIPDLSGSLLCSIAINAGSSRVDADISNDRARLIFSASSTGAATITFTFSYEVI